MTSRIKGENGDISLVFPLPRLIDYRRVFSSIYGNLKAEPPIFVGKNAMFLVYFPVNQSIDSWAVRLA